MYLTDSIDQRSVVVAVNHTTANSPAESIVGIICLTVQLA